MSDADKKWTIEGDDLKCQSLVDYACGYCGFTDCQNDCAGALRAMVQLRSVRDDAQKPEG